MADTLTRVTRIEPSNFARLVRIFDNPNQRIEFEDGYIHYVHPEALIGVTQLNVNNLRNSQVHFLGKLRGVVPYEGSFRHDSGVVNVNQCTDVLFTGLTALNEKVFSPGNLTTESSCAVNVNESRVRFERCRFDGLGKIALSVHSGSYVELSDVILAAYYFELLVGASEVVGDDVQFIQDHPDPDSHSAIWLGSSVRQAITNKLFTNSTVTLNNPRFNMSSGRAICSGNGSYHTRSTLKLNSPTFSPERDPTFGLCIFHENYNSITVETDLNGVDPLTGQPMLDYVSTPEQGFGKFVDYYSTPTYPGKGLYTNDEEPAPIRVDGLSSNAVAII